MSRIAMKSAAAALVALLGVALAPETSCGWDCPPPLAPPRSHAYGKSFERWNVLYTQWMVRTYLGGQTPSNTVDGVRFLPNNPQPGTYEFDVHLRPGTPFVVAPFPLFGERYDDPNVPDDNPNDPFIDVIFEMTDVRLVLDGHVLMDGAASELDRFGYGPEYFNHPIVYAQPQPRGPNLNAVAALWTQGVGAVFHPLPRGRHTLVNTVNGLLGSYRFTYHITVR